MAKILIVDDSYSMREMVKATLLQAGFSLEQAEDGVIALNCAKKEKFDLVLADVNMPNMDGITLTTKLRELSNYKFTPILILTTESSQDKKLEGRKAGATGWIVKPFEPEKLVAVINKVL